MGGELHARDGFDLTIGEEKVHVIDRGVGDSTLLLLHGFPLSTELSFGRLLPLLPGDQRVVAPDHVGLGWSDRGRHGTYDLAAQATRVQAVMDALGIRSATVVGTSFGGGVAQHLALQAPDRVERLVLLASIDASDPAPSWRQEWIHGLGIAGLLSATRLPWLGRKVRLKVSRPHDGWTADWTEQHALDASLYTQVPGTVRSAWKVMIDMSRAQPVDISHIRAPTLVVSGADDTRVPPAVGAAIAEKIPGAEHTVIPRCPHGLSTHQPEAVVAAILRHG